MNLKIPAHDMLLGFFVRLLQQDQLQESIGILLQVQLHADESEIIYFDRKIEWMDEVYTFAMKLLLR